MKRALTVLSVAGLTMVITFLAVTKYMAEQRAAKLDKALMDAEARLIQLEGDLGTANQRLAQLSQAREPSPPPVTPGQAVPATRPPGVGLLVRYAAFSRAGLTNRIRIEGTSSVHDWQVESSLIGGSAELGPGFPVPPEGQAAGGPVEAKVSVFIPVRSLKSVERDGRPYSDKMDEIMYEKLREPDNKRITYTLTSLTLQDPPRGATNHFLYEAKGNLCVAGVTNAITMPVDVMTDPAGCLAFAGLVKVKMTDFKIDPPSPKLGMGAITTGDEVTLHVRWWVRRTGSAPASL